MRFVIRILISISFMFLVAVSCGCGNGNISNNADAKPESTPPTISDGPKIIAYGDSLTAGFGLASWEMSYPAMLQRSVDAAGYNYQVVNYGRNGDTAEAGLKRLWLALGVSNIKIFILALGANDVVRQTPPDEIKRNLSEIIRQVKEKNVKVLLCGIYAPERYGPEYGNAIKQMYVNLARENDVLLMPTLMQDVSDFPERMLPDNVHPNEEGAKVIEKNVFAAVMPLLEKDVQEKKK